MNDNNGDGSSIGAWDFMEIPIDDIGKMTNKKLVEELVKRGQPKGKLNKSELQLTIFPCNKKKVCCIIGVLFWINFYPKRKNWIPKFNPKMQLSMINHLTKRSALCCCLNTNLHHIPNPVNREERIDPNWQLHRWINGQEEKYRASLMHCEGFNVTLCIICYQHFHLDADIS